MPENVEIKAKLINFEKTLNIAKDLCNTDGILLEQEDVFFNVPQGRLKLRSFELTKAKNFTPTVLNVIKQDGTDSQLISYTRPDIEGPKVSNYSICKTNKNILPVLKSALGVKGIVKKKRQLFLYGQTRIHLDKVEDLGDFLELEVVLTEGQAASEGVTIANELLKKLEISEEQLIKGAYIDFQ